MNDKKEPANEWSSEMRRIMRDYPRLKASADFNQRVLAALAQKQAQHGKIILFCDAIDRIFERPLLKIVGTITLAIMLAWCSSSILLLHHPPAEMPHPQMQPTAANLYAQMNKDRFAPPL